MSHPGMALIFLKNWTFLDPSKLEWNVRVFSNTGINCNALEPKYIRVIACVQLQNAKKATNLYQSVSSSINHLERNCF